MTSHEAKEFVIRPCQPSDIPELLQFIRELADYERLTDQCIVTAADLEAVLFGPRPAGEALLGFANGQPAVFAIFFQTLSTFLGKAGIYLEDLFVRPAFRRRGYAKAVLTYLARLANQRGCGRFEWAVLDWNTPAITFYESLGAQILPDWRVCRLTGEALTKLGG